MLCCFVVGKRKRLNAVGLHLYNNPHNHPAKDAQLYYAQKQCDFFNFPLVVDRNELPQEVTLALAVNQHMSAAATLLLGNPRKWKYLVWGANAEDSFAQRLQLRFPIRAYLAQKSYQLDLHGVSAHEVMNAPINIFPYETLYKSEVVSMLAKNLWHFAQDNIWYCYPSDRDPERIAKIGGQRKAATLLVESVSSVQNGKMQYKLQTNPHLNNKKEHLRNINQIKDG